LKTDGGEICRHGGRKPRGNKEVIDLIRFPREPDEIAIIIIIIVVVVVVVSVVFKTLPCIILLCIVVSTSRSRKKKF